MDDTREPGNQTNEELRWVIQYFQRRIKKLEKSNEDMEAFNYSVSHDLRAPLRRVQGLSEMLRGDHMERLDAEGQEILQKICAECHRMEVIINDVLQLSRITSTEMRVTRINLSELAHAIATMHRETEPDRQVEFLIDEGLQVRGDTTLMRLLMENLIGNAWKFTSKRDVAQIKVGKTMSKSRDAYFVGDNGIGFDMADAANLYKPFHRLHSAVEYHGNGIGLSTVRRIVKRHRGEVWAESEMDKGAIFYFTLSL